MNNVSGHGGGLDRLAKLANKGSRTVVGLMSGTSHDGVDAAVAKVYGAGASAKAELVRHRHEPYPAALRERVAEAFDGPTRLVCELNFELGGFFADAALAAISEAGLSPSDVDLIGSHGQTIHHIPPGAGIPSTLQIGEGAVIAARTGIVTVSDFRTADIAAGGQGAPLTPLADWILFRESGEVTVVVNIGGITNLSVVTEELSGVTGFDTGPGNSLIDEAVRIFTDGRMGYDDDGAMAAKGRPDDSLTRSLMAHPYFSQPPPKSTGRELFGKALAEGVIADNPDMSPEDILCTFTRLTALSLRDAFERSVRPATKVDRIALCGGGARNGFLVSLIEGLFKGVEVVTVDALGVPSMAREALCFAVLTNETICGNAGNAPAATGAVRPAILGKISL